jgi:adenosylmethionine-8-amino-7-oxononanoate aminotransferase
MTEFPDSLIWRPFTSLRSQRNPLKIVRAEGLYLITEDGRKIADLNASWWVNIHGHSHPYIHEALRNHLEKFDHVMFSDCTHEPAEKLAFLLKKHIPQTHSKIFFSDNGSTAVEVGLKMATQYFYLQGIARKRFLALQGGYHGDTFGGMSSGDRTVFNRPFSSLLFDVFFVEPPQPDNLHSILETLEYQHKKNPFIGFVYEPLVQGAAGMKMHDAQALNQMLAWCKANHILCIADEVMTGLGRTGTFLASDQMQEKPDILCLSKGLTGGILPLGVTTVDEKIVQIFRNPSPEYTFYHGHSYTAYALACAASCACLEIFQKENTLEKIRRIEEIYHAQKTSFSHAFVSGFRVKGSICAMEIMYEGKEADYLHPLKGKIFDFFLEHNILVRPLGNTFYLIPPYCIKEEEILYCFEVLKKFLKQL